MRTTILLRLVVLVSVCGCLGSGGPGPGPVDADMDTFVDSAHEMDAPVDANFADRLSVDTGIDAGVDRASSSWSVLPELMCPVGRLVEVGCHTECGLGACTGDPVLRVCDAAGSYTACTSGSSALAENDDYRACGPSLCSLVRLTCPSSGRLLPLARPFSAMSSFTCDARVRVVDLSDGGTRPDTGLPTPRDAGPGCPATRNCSGRVCGPDPVCATSCGTCPGGAPCNSAGQCGCVRQCAGRACGPDGCGGSCGTCPGGRTCNGAGQCECVRQCSGRSCGADGCGGSCGSCGSNQQCTPAGQCMCVPQCSGRMCGPNGCGGMCGTCGPGTRCQDSNGRCYNACGNPGDPCCESGGPGCNLRQCNLGAVCARVEGTSNYRCVACGNAGQLCCQDCRGYPLSNGCNLGTVCLAGACIRR